MWRPPNWNEVKNKDITGRDNPTYCAGFECGADTMLEALKKQTERYCLRDENCYAIKFPLPHKPKGWIIFIPDEDGEKWEKRRR